jgi:hypothetical protein
VQSDYAWPTLTFVALAVLSVAGDWWRHRRVKADRTLSRAGWVPWPLVTILSVIAAAFSAAAWLHGS